MDKQTMTSPVRWPGFRRPQTAAEYLDVSEATIYRWIKEGKLKEPVQISPKVTGWPKNELDIFAEQIRGIMLND
ncbi:helix-turn-helix transcriptional regulator [Acidithiobacillus sp. IBUN Pt1247-S3]|uniref:helix-turn-helix transcriptional regulator n=1 Tax=Acidithiobacillus sp. IBUN Pt1247-S3 TaxID=3166642 RepID=UPI0034E58E82